MDGFVEINRIVDKTGVICELPFSVKVPKELFGGPDKYGVLLHVIKELSKKLTETK